MSKEDIIYDMVKDLKENQENIKDDVSDIKNNLQIHVISLERYNELLNVHISGVNTLKKLHLDNAKRIEMLEEPVRIKKIIYSRSIKIIAFLTAVIGLILAIKNL